MLAFRALEVRGPVVLPSFTFSASAHAVAWNGLEPRFAECDPATFNLDVADATSRAQGAAAVLSTHVYGNPCDVEAVEALGRSRGLRVVFDAAHGFGATRAGRAIGSFGDAEVFSLSPTKLVISGEGGVVTTPHAEVAERIRIGRDYGNPGDYDTQFVGLNARMSELHAAVALESLAGLDDHLARRRALADRYAKGLAGIPGVRLQVVADDDESTYKDLTIAIGPEFGAGRDAVVGALAAEGIDTRKYFSPPVHRQTAYADLPAVDLPVTDAAAAAVISLPMFAALEPTEVDTVVDVVAGIQAHAGEVATAVAR
jgi:dTDP-4-amino-4,6-dideoxygalactose transaminase